jgi:hypothetical protein
LNKIKVDKLEAQINFKNKNDESSSSEKEDENVEKARMNLKKKYKKSIFLV